MSNILREAAQQALSRLDQIAVRFPEDTELREQLRMILAQPDDGEKPVEAWHSNRKVSVYADVVLRVWGPNIEAQMAEAPRTAQAVQDAFAWLYADDKVPRVTPEMLNTLRQALDDLAGITERTVEIAAMYGLDDKAQPLGWMRPDELQKAAKAPYQCRVHPEKDKHADMIPVFAAPQSPAEQGADVRDAETELNCAEEVLDAIAANLNMEETSFDCIGDYITAVVNEIRNPKGLGWSAGRLVNCQDCGSVNDSMNRQCRTCGYAFPVSNDQQGAELSDEQICEIAERFEASDPCSSFWKEFARAILAADRAARGGS